MVLLASVDMMDIHHVVKTFHFADLVFILKTAVLKNMWNEEHQEEAIDQLYNIGFGVCIFCGNHVEYCPISCLLMSEEYELSS